MGYLWPVLTLVLLLVVAPTDGVTLDLTPDPFSSEDLSSAIDAAIITLHSTPGWFQEMKRNFSYVNAMMLTTCTPNRSRWLWPNQSTAQGLLQRVFRSGTLKVGGVIWKNAPVADYQTDPVNPTGFWPKYLSEIMRVFNDHYQTNIKVVRSYFEDSNWVNLAVQDTTVDMSEPYYYISGFVDVRPRIEVLEFSCVTAGTEGKFIVKNTSSINTVGDLNAAIDAGPVRDMGFIAQGNFDSVSELLTKNVVHKFIPNGDTSADQVYNGQLIAAYVSEGLPPDSFRFKFISTGLVSPRVIMYRRSTGTCECPASGGNANNGVTTPGSSASTVINMFNSGSCCGTNCK